MNAINTTQDPTAFPLAAIVPSEHGVTDDLLSEFAHSLRRDGWRVLGLIQQERGGQGKAFSRIVDIDTDQGWPLFQNLGAGSDSCSLDPSSIASASFVLRETVEKRPDLAVANRFGALEASGGGLAAEMLALISNGIPLMTIVSAEHLENWRAVTGHVGAELPPEMDALRAWFASIQPSQETLP